jgi:signal transduction histidine kinase
MMNADAARVQQIVLNLLTNAIKFTPEGGRISVSIDHSVCSPNTVCIRVEDTGIGIPLGKLDAIFEPFVQLLQSTPGAHDGLGLGLAISRDLARAMGGDLTAASAKGFGTTFLLTLPGAPVS